MALGLPANERCILALSLPLVLPSNLEVGRGDEAVVGAGDVEEREAHTRDGPGKESKIDGRRQDRRSVSRAKAKVTARRHRQPLARVMSPAIHVNSCHSWSSYKVSYRKSLARVIKPARSATRDATC